MTEHIFHDTTYQNYSKVLESRNNCNLGQAFSYFSALLGQSKDLKVACRQRTYSTRHLSQATGCHHLSKLTNRIVWGHGVYPYAPPSLTYISSPKRQMGLTIGHLYIELYHFV